MIRVQEGGLQARVGVEVRECGPGDVAAVPGGELHGFRVLGECTLEVYAWHDIGTIYPIDGDPDGERWSSSAPTCPAVAATARAGVDDRL